MVVSGPKAVVGGPKVVVDGPKVVVDGPKVVVDRKMGVVGESRRNSAALGRGRFLVLTTSDNVESD